MYKFIFIFIVFLIQTDLLSDTTDTNEVKLLLEKTEYIEGDTILLTIEFDFNKGDSVAYYYTNDFLYGVTLTDENGRNLKVLTYFIAKFGFVISPEIPVKPNEVQKIVTNLNCFTTEDKSHTFDNRCVDNLLPGIYAVSFYESRIVRLYGKNAFANTLSFRVLPKEK